MKLRQGRKNPYNLYLQIGDDPSDADISIGYMRYPNWARAVVDAVNATGGVERPRSGNAEVEWERSEELRVDRMGPSDQDVKVDDPDRPVRRLP